MQNTSNTNPAMQLATDYLDSTNTIVFLTGKAGTGKTTFLQQLRQVSTKKMAIAAPTGVAAINAGGMTIHSLFQIPFGPLIPATGNPDLSYSDEKRELLGSLELLIIDEVSMLRPDVLDQIDLILRTIKGSQQPFGGVQLLLIGDLAQLSPIIREDEWRILSSYYSTPYFFSSLVMQRASYVRIELDHVYRQKEQAFVDILNEVRNQTISEASLALLNARHEPGFRPGAEDSFITLTTHNNLAQQLNNEFLEALPGQLYEFAATIRGDFPKDAYPTETNLKLKIGAQVMFVKNDGSAEKLFYNGKIGYVARIDGSTVYVQCGNESREIAVEAVEWTNVKYQLAEEQINESEAGSFAQIPLKLAWSITIHKSQGLSFDKAIIDVSEAFAHGQAYVALSRCRTLTGMVLRNPISARNIIGDPSVTRFNEAAERIKPDADSLKRDQERYRLFLLTELFNFQGLKAVLKGFAGLAPNLEKDIMEVAEKFMRRPETADDERIKKAAAYFLDKLKTTTENLHGQIPFLIGNSIEKAAKADRLIQWMMARISLLEYFGANAFTTDSFLDRKRSAKAAALADKSRSYLRAMNAKPNEELLGIILAWREERAATDKVMPSMLLSEQTAAAIAEKLPQTLKALSGIKGVGPQKSSIYGADIIGMIRAYQQKQSGQEIDQASLF
jgi:hypothetical protein